MNDSRRTILRATVAGVMASIAMGMFAMVAAATYQDTGFFTPLYHIASLVMSPSTMMGSMMAAQQGTTSTFDAGPAIVGLMIHMMTGAMFGAIFGVALTRLPAMATLPRVAVGAAYGVVAFAASTFVLLPLASHVANDSNAIDTMAKIVGYPTFLAEHVLFGAVLGLLSVSRAARPATERSKVTAA